MSASSANLAGRYLNGSANGLTITVASNTTLTISSGTCIDSSNSTNMSLSSSATLNAANSGVVNGIDTGSFAASKTYYIYLIDSSVRAVSSGALMSLSSSSPTLPVGYDRYRMIGFAFSDGSTHFITVDQVGSGNLRQYYFDTSISVLSGGTATTLTAIDLSAAVPVIDKIPVLIEVEVTPATANDKASFSPAGSTATVLPHVTGSVAAKINSGQLKVLSKLASSLPKIQYINSAASGSTNVWVYGFEHII